MAERVGFEPTIPVKVYTLSKRAPSATRPSLLKQVSGFLIVPDGRAGTAVCPERGMRIFAHVRHMA